MTICYACGRANCTNKGCEEFHDKIALLKSEPTRQERQKMMILPIPDEKRAGSRLPQPQIVKWYCFQCGNEFCGDAKHKEFSDKIMAMRRAAPKPLCVICRTAGCEDAYHRKYRFSMTEQEWAEYAKELPLELRAKNPALIVPDNVIPTPGPDALDEIPAPERRLLAKIKAMPPPPPPDHFPTLRPAAIAAKDAVAATARTAIAVKKKSNAAMIIIWLATGLIVFFFLHPPLVEKWDGMAAFPVRSRWLWDIPEHRFGTRYFVDTQPQTTRILIVAVIGAALLGTLAARKR